MPCGDFQVYVIHKGGDDWRAECMIPGDDADYEYRSSGGTWRDALLNLISDLRNESWDCEHPKGDNWE